MMEYCFEGGINLFSFRKIGDCFRYYQEVKDIVLPDDRENFCRALAHAFKYQYLVNDDEAYDPRRLIRWYPEMEGYLEREIIDVQFKKGSLPLF